MIKKSRMIKKDAENSLKYKEIKMEIQLCWIFKKKSDSGSS
jgi:hypothetical protein